MKKIFLIVLVSMLVFTACDNDLEQIPPNIASPDSLTDFTGVLNGAYYYQTAAGTPLSVMGEYRADNTQFDESPHISFAAFNGDVLTMEGDFFQPFYANLYKSILSANNVIENSANSTQVAEAKFLRGLAYLNLVKVFGDVPINLSASPSTSDTSILVRKSVADVYGQIITDLSDAMSNLDNSGIATGRASKIAAQGLLGRAYVYMGDYVSAEPYLRDVVNAAAGAGISLQANFADIFGNDLNSEILYSTQISGAITAGSGTVFAFWFGGNDSKGDDFPITNSLVNAFDAAGDVTRKNVTINRTSAVRVVGTKFNSGDQDFIDLRLGDAILLYAEALNENGSTPAAITQLNKIRSRANLANTTAVTQATVRTAIANERRLELALEGQRFFDLVRTGTLDAAMGKTISSNYHVFPLPTSEIFASGEVITQNAGY